MSSRPERAHVARLPEVAPVSEEGAAMRLVPPPAPPDGRSDHAAPPAAPRRTRSLPGYVQMLLLTALAAGGWFAYARLNGETGPARSEAPATAEAARPFVPSAAQLATFTIATATARDFQVELATEGKIGPDEDRTTPIFSPYSGRVARLVARQGSVVQPGEVLFTVEATDMVQAQTDLVAANGGLNKARSQLQLAGTVERRQKELFDSKAVALREWQSAQNDLVSAQNDLKAAEGALDAVRNRLRILGRTDPEIASFLQNGRMSAEAPIASPIGGTVIARKVGPGQYVSSGSADPAYTVGDLSRVWLLAQVREADAPQVRVGQSVTFRVLAFPDRVFAATVSYVGAAIDPASRRVQVRADIDNREGVLKPEMFASVRLATGAAQLSPAIPKEAVIYEGDAARAWILLPGGAVELRQVRTGLVGGGDIQILSGVAAGEKVIARGALFIDRLATGGGS